jgi:hypothetical protein
MSRTYILRNSWIPRTNSQVLDCDVVREGDKLLWFIQMLTENLGSISSILSLGLGYLPLLILQRQWFQVAIGRW